MFLDKDLFMNIKKGNLILNSDSLSILLIVTYPRNDNLHKLYWKDSRLLKGEKINKSTKYFK